MDAYVRESLKKLIRKRLHSMVGKEEIDKLVREVVQEEYSPLIHEALKQSLEETTNGDIFREEMPNSETETKRSPTDTPSDTLERNPGSEEARYLYCVVEDEDSVDFGRIGIEDSRVYTLSTGGLAAVVHDCPPVPYKSEKEGKVKEWLSSHQQVLDRQIENYEAVIPARFNTIFDGEEGKAPGEVVKEWIEDEYEQLVSQLTRIRGLREYGVQVFYNREKIANKLVDQTEELVQLRDKLGSMNSGKAYLHREKLNQMLEDQLTSWSEEEGEKIRDTIAKIAEEITEENPKKGKEGEEMFVNLSCLVEGDKVKELGDKLEQLDANIGIRVKFTGPWAPYSFTGLENQKGQ